MEELLEQDLVPSLKNVQVKVVETSIAKENKKNSVILYIILFAYLLIPVLSIEGVVGWFLGVSGAYKTLNLYRSNKDNKNRKSVRLLIIYTVIAVLYNLIVYYGQKYVVAKTV